MSSVHFHMRKPKRSEHHELFTNSVIILLYWKIFCIQFLYTFAKDASPCELCVILLVFSGDHMATHS